MFSPGSDSTTSDPSQHELVLTDKIKTDVRKWRWRNGFLCHLSWVKETKNMFDYMPLRSHVHLELRSRPGMVATSEITNPTEKRPCFKKNPNVQFFQTVLQNSMHRERPPLMADTWLVGLSDRMGGHLQAVYKAVHCSVSGFNSSALARLGWQCAKGLASTWYANFILLF